MIISSILANDRGGVRKSNAIGVEMICGTESGDIEVLYIALSVSRTRIQKPNNTAIKVILDIYPSL